jgi:hypothetical protein
MAKRRFSPLKTTPFANCCVITSISRARDEYGETALIDTVSDSIAELLINAGANVNAKNKEGKTALIEAAEQNYVDKLRVLLKAPGIHLEQRDRNGRTALMMAQSRAIRIASGYSLLRVPLCELRVSSFSERLKTRWSIVLVERTRTRRVHLLLLRFRSPARHLRLRISQRGLP